MAFDYTSLQWALVIGSSLLLFAVSPFARTPAAFFRGARREQTPGTLALLSSLVISWLFAKSITNAANLGLSFGIMGGVAYAAYYLSFAVAGIVIYFMRTRGGFTSIHHFLRGKFGRGAVLLFSLLICFRLFNEVWSNTMVIGSYFGDVGTAPYYWAIGVFTGLTLAYSLKGGMSSSILTDVIQMVLFGILLTVILGAILPRIDYDMSALLDAELGGGAGAGNAGAMNLLLVAVLQSLSYPFHDPVLTDRGFIAEPGKTLRAYLWAVPLGGVCIVLFSLVGVYGGLAGVQGQAPVEVARLLGGPILLVMNFIMITSAASTLDSTFSSFAKLAVVDLSGGDSNELSPLAGRIAMVGITLVGTIPVFLNPTILSATTVSGAMVVGLAPVFCLWWLPAPRYAFTVSVGTGLLFGFCYVFGWWPAVWNLDGNAYADLLSVSMVSLIVCFAIYGGLCCYQNYRLRRATA